MVVDLVEAGRAHGVEAAQQPRRVRGPPAAGAEVVQEPGRARHQRQHPRHHGQAWPGLTGRDVSHTKMFHEQIGVAHKDVSEKNVSGVSVSTWPPARRRVCVN